MWEVILALVIIGLLLLAVELFMPGMILGILGGAALAAAVAVTFATHGMVPGLLVAVGLLVVATVGFLVWLRIFPSTYVGRKLSLASAIGGPNEYPDYSALLGAAGHAATMLRPAGTAVIGGKRIDVVADGEFVEPGTAIVVARVEGGRVVVRKR